MKGKTFLLYLVALFTILLLVLYLDYNNIPSNLGFDTSQINTEIIGIILDAVETICVFLFAYYLIDRWEIRKNKNQMEVANQILLYTYERFKYYTCYFADNKENRIQVKNEGSTNLYNDSIDVKNIPFENDEIIMQLFNEGAIDKSQLVYYLDIKVLYRLFIRFVNDVTELQENPNELHERNLLACKKSIVEKVDSAIKELEKYRSVKRKHS